MNKRDALLFQNLCSFIWHNGTPLVFVYDLSDDVCVKGGVTFETLTHLDSIGLIRFENLSGFRIIQRESIERITLSYFGERVTIDSSRQFEKEFHIGHVMLTQIGKELSAVCDAQSIAGFSDYCVSRWAFKGLSPASPIVPQK
jgi:hypothetical protein